MSIMMWRNGMRGQRGWNMILKGDNDVRNVLICA